MTYSANLVNILVRALDDSEFRQQLMKDFRAAIAKYEPEKKLSGEEMTSLEHLFEGPSVVGQGQTETMACPYRGYA